MRKAPLLLFLAVAAAGCGVEEDPRPTSFRYIHEAIVKPSCATAACHSLLNNRELVQMETYDEAYGYFVDAARKEESQIYGLIGGEIEADLRRTDGLRMPLDQPLPEADILLIGRWIDEGARDN